MKKSARFLMGLLVPAFMLAGVAANPAMAQQKAGASAKDLVGTWMLVSNNTTLPDGKLIQPFGPNPAGMLVFDTAGRYSLQICRPGRAKFASNNREKGTAEENQATVSGCNPHWGKYSVDEKDRAIVFQIEHGTFPNWEGIQQKRPFTIAGDELKYTVPAASVGGVAEVLWKRAK